MSNNKNNTPNNSNVREQSSNIRYSSQYDNIQSYLFSLDSSAFNELYKEPSSTLAVYRLLTPLAKQIVMSLLFAEDRVEIITIYSWFKTNADSEFKIALRIAAKFKILIRFKGENINPNGPNRPESKESQKKYLRMNAGFKKSLQTALCGGSNSGTLGFGKLAKEPNHSRPTKKKLDSYSEKKKESILHCMVESSRDNKLTKNVKNLLVVSGLMSKKENEPMKITNRGFQFLLKDSNAQAWTFLLQYLAMVSKYMSPPISEVEVLKLYFLLSSLEFGKGYSMATLTVDQRRILDVLPDYGVIYKLESKSETFYPTRMATTLISGELNNVVQKNAPTLKAPKELGGETNVLSGLPGTLVVETNYRVYAYTKSQLQIAILNLFMNLKQRFDDMVVGYLDRDSVRKAFEHGITADQIIHYLESHAHPTMLKDDPIIPLTVVDQIKLWEIEKNRIKSKSGKLWTQFARNQDFKAIYDFAKEQGFVLWSNPEKKMMIITEKGHIEVEKYAKIILSSNSGN